jgi:CO dehydrogenase maturation factor
MKDLIRERVGAEPGKATVYFKMNPKVDDIPEKFSVERNGVRLMAMGTVRRGGSGCVCPENVMVRQLLSHLLVQRDEVVLMDMEAGIEHLGRGTTQFVDVLLAVVEPSTASLHTLERMRKLAGDLGMKRVAVVANRVGSADGAARIAREAGEEPWCTVPYSDTLSDYHGQGAGAEIEAEIDSLRIRIEEEQKHG